MEKLNTKTGEHSGASLCSKFVVLSLGAGVQSSTMALMAAHGEIGPMPNCAIFADTQAEPESVYRWLEWLEKQLPYPVYRVTKGNLAEAACKVHVSKKSGMAYTNSNVPVFIKMPGTDKEGKQSRQCTQDYKVLPIQRKIRELIGRKKSAHCIQWIGISVDEAHRMKPSRKPWITNQWPLIDRGMRRIHCLKWMEKHGYPKPPRSACSFCPFHGQAEWRRIRDEDPKAFAQAVQFEKDYQAAFAKIPRISGTPYLHRSLVPIDQADLSDYDDGMVDMFGNECEGMCGV
jgi:hypothetical protein